MKEWLHLIKKFDHSNLLITNAEDNITIALERFIYIKNGGDSFGC